MTALILRGDALHLPLADASVDLVVTSPPYFALRSYQDAGAHYAGQIGAEPTPQAFLDALWAATAEMVRVLKPSGSIFVVLGDKYSGAKAQTIGGINRAEDSARTWAQTYPRRTGIPNKSLMGIPWRYTLGCIDDIGLILRAEVVWSKPNGLPESATDRVRRSHEQIFHFTKEPCYYSATDEVREAHKYPEDTRHLRGSSYDSTMTGSINSPLNPLGKLPGSVWTIPTEALVVPEHVGVNHFAAFPSEIVRRIILAWSPSGAVVLDPFAGTGTTLMVARALGRKSIGLDISGDYCRLAKWRVWHSGGGSKAMSRTNAEAQMGLL